MKIFIAGDHAGFELKNVLKEYLENLGYGYQVEDMGPYDYHEEDDYPDYVMPLAKKVAEAEGSMGVVIGGSGQGEAMCANRVKGIRTAVFYGQELIEEGDGGKPNPDTFEIIELARKHNDANILSLGARFISPDEAKFATQLFLRTEFSDEERHVRRLSKF